MVSGRVLRILSDRFIVDLGENTATVKARKKIKRESAPLAGDVVTLEETGGEWVLCGIEPRRNRIVRPPIANLDRIVITVAPVPQTDFLTVDKMILNAHAAGIRTVLCVNKTDLMPHGFLQDVTAQYGGVCDEVISVCAGRGEVRALRDLLSGGFSCLAGQSAVGKTSLVNAICGVRREVGDLSEKTQRGKNTTVDVELIKIAPDTFVADTPGFGALALTDVPYDQIQLYYDEYVRLSGGCKYHMCTHTFEPDCAVKRAVEEGTLPQARYERYCRLFEEGKAIRSHRKSWRNANDFK